jgi:high-affinity iron transporter
VADPIEVGEASGRTMLASLLIVFREMLEAGLIVGIVLAATAGVPGRGLWVGGGVVAGLLGACVVAGFTDVLANAFNGVGQEVFTAAILSLAVVMLSGHCLWMAKHARELTASMKAAGQAVRDGERSLLALAIVVAIAVLREGSEVVLFLYGIAVSGKEGGLAMLLGGVLGVAGGGVVSYLLYRGLLAIPVRRFFSLTNGLIALLAAGMAGQAAAVLAGVDILPSWGEHIWNSSGLLAENSMLGRALHALMGYSDRPCGIQLAAYAATLAILLVSMRLIGLSQAAETDQARTATSHGAA